MSEIHPKLLISDLDGTLLFTRGNERKFKEEDIRAIRKFQKNGNLVVVNSGRNVGWLMEPLEDHVSWDYLIASTGGLIVEKTCDSSGKQQVIKEHCISREAIENLLARVGDNQSFTFQTMYRVYAMNPTRVYGMPMTTIRQISDIPDPIYGISLHYESEREAGKFAAWFQQEQITGIACYQNKEDIDMVAAGCSKGTGIEELREYLRIPIEKCYVIGDSYNDIEMLKAVPHSFTFRESPKEVRENAKYMVDSVAELIAVIE